MAFQAPRIIGGGQIIQPQAQGNPFKGVEDAYIRNRDRKDKLEKERLERKAQLDRDRAAAAASFFSNPETGLPLDEAGNPMSIKGYTEALYPEQSYQPQEQPTLLDLTREKVGYGEGQWAPGKFAGMGLLGAAGLGYKGLGALGRGIGNAFSSEVTGVIQPDDQNIPVNQPINQPVNQPVNQQNIPTNQITSIS